jgi:hypothetical protein
MIHTNSITKTRRPCSKLQGTFKLEVIRIDSNSECYERGHDDC